MTGTTPIDVIIQGDCLEEMKKLPDGCIDMILCDLPYGTTALDWDNQIPLDNLWTQYKRILKSNGAVLLLSSQPFTTDLICANRGWFKYSLVWKKTTSTGFVHAKNKPLKIHEDILVFSPGTTVHKTQSKNRMVYNPQMVPGKPYIKGAPSSNGILHKPTKANLEFEGTFSDGSRYPNSVLEFANPNHGSLHPTQKPVALFEYLIKTYTNEGDLVLDNCIGSGTTAVAAKRTGRHFIGIELSSEYCEIARKRVAAVPARLDRWAEAEG